jgi:hypothetical protein
MRLQASLVGAAMTALCAVFAQAGAAAPTHTTQTAAKNATPSLIGQTLPLTRQKATIAKATGTQAVALQSAGDEWIQPSKGFYAELPIQDPFVAPGAESDVEIFVEDRNGNSILLGWGKTGPDGPHLFAQTRVEGNPDFDAGFIPLSGAPYHLNEAFLASSTPFGMQLSNFNGEWWAAVAGAWIGHWPASHWPHGFTRAQVEAATGVVFDDPVFPTTDMGNSLFASKPGALVMQNPKLDLDGDGLTDKPLTFSVGATSLTTHSSWYSIHTVTPDGQKLAYGGPGADH